MESAVEWGAAAQDSRSANPLFERNHLLYKELRRTPAGCEAIAELMDHPDPVVKLLAATHSLAWRETEAIVVLETIESMTRLNSVSAQYTLLSHRAGSLNLDW